mgnify:CR=1 FL=1
MGLYTGSIHGTDRYWSTFLPIFPYYSSHAWASSSTSWATVVSMPSNWSTGLALTYVLPTPGAGLTETFYLWVAGGSSGGWPGGVATGANLKLKVTDTGDGSTYGNFIDEYSHITGWWGESGQYWRVATFGVSSSSRTLRSVLAAGYPGSAHVMGRNSVASTGNVGVSQVLIEQRVTFS